MSLPRSEGEPLRTVVPRTDAVLLAALGVAVAAGLAAATAIAAHFEFLMWDDDRIVGWIAARDAGSRLAWLWGTEATSLPTPVTATWWGLLADVAGPSPFAFHLAGALLHVLCVALVALTCREVLRLVRPAAGEEGAAGAWIASAAAAGFWGLHPARAEVIGWMAAMPYPLSTALSLASFVAFLRAGAGDDRRARTRLVLAGLLYLLANLAHPQAAPLCVVFLLVDRLLRPESLGAGEPPASRGFRVAWHASMFAVAVGVAVAGIGLRSAPPSPGYGEGASADVLRELVKYLGFAGDFGLLHAWAPRGDEPGAYELASLREPAFLLGLLALAAISAVAWRRARAGERGLLVALLAHLAFALPDSGPFVWRYTPGDRYAYEETIVAAVVLACLAHDLLARLGASPRRRALVVAASLALTGLATSGLVSTLAQWHDTVALMEHLIAKGSRIEWKLFAGVRLAQYWRLRHDDARARAAVLRVADIPGGGEEERVPRVVRYLARGGYCDEAALILEARGGGLPDERRASLRGEVGGCRPDGW